MYEKSHLETSIVGYLRWISRTDAIVCGTDPSVEIQLPSPKSRTIHHISLTSLVVSDCRVSFGFDWIASLRTNHFKIMLSADTSSWHFLGKWTIKIIPKWRTFVLMGSSREMLANSASSYSHTSLRLLRSSIFTWLHRERLDGWPID